MVNNPPADMPRITPYLYYDNVAAALEWLSRSFGLSVRFTMPDPSGGVMHAEMALSEGVVMMGPSNPPLGGQSPQQIGAVNQGLYVYVDDVDAHCETARNAGARITMEPEEMFWGDRIYAAQDIEGHQWTFAQHIKDVPPDQMTPP